MTKTPNASTGRWPYRFEIVPLDDNLIVDAYQRPLTSFADKIGQHFNPALVGTLILSERVDRNRTRYAVVDGQTRVEGAKRAEQSHLPALIYEGLSVADEADLFALLQTERRGMTSASRFKAQVIAGKPEQVAIDRILTARGFRVGMTTDSPSTIAAVAALEWVYRGGSERKNAEPHADLLIDTLNVIREAWPSLPDTARGAVTLKGLGWFIDEEDPNLERLVERLSRVTPSQLASRADAFRDSQGLTGSAPRFMGEAIKAQYLKNARSRA